MSENAKGGTQKQWNPDYVQELRERAESAEAQVRAFRDLELGSCPHGIRAAAVEKRLEAERARADALAADLEKLLDDGIGFDAPASYIAWEESRK
jgi:hypothetical protein